MHSISYASLSFVTLPVSLDDSHINKNFMYTHEEEANVSTVVNINSEDIELADETIQLEEELE